MNIDQLSLPKIVMYMDNAYGLVPMVKEYHDFPEHIKKLVVMIEDDYHDIDESGVVVVAALQCTKYQDEN